MKLDIEKLKELAKISKSFPDLCRNLSLESYLREKSLYKINILMTKMKNKKHIQGFIRFNENLNMSDVSDIIIKQEEKTNETYEFINQYLDVIDFDSYINNNNLYQVVARYDNSIIGIRIFRMNDGKIHLNYSAVIPEFRNKGLNKKMFNEIEKIGISNNVNIITSNVRESNISSLKSLLGSGFQINKNYDLKYPDGEKKIPLFKRL